VCGPPMIQTRTGGSVVTATDLVSRLVMGEGDGGAIGEAVVWMSSDEELRAEVRRRGADVAPESGWDRRVGQFPRFCDGLMMERSGAD